MVIDVYSVIDANVFADLLGVGALGFVGGVLFPWGFCLVGYVVDSVRVVVNS